MIVFLMGFCESSSNATKLWKTVTILKNIDQHGHVIFKA